MTQYEFFIADGAEGKFQAANSAIRSQAMKTALRLRSKIQALIPSAAY